MQTSGWTSSLSWASPIISIIFASAQLAVGGDSPSAQALLRGVLESRTAHQRVRARITQTTLEPTPEKSRTLLVELDGARRRFEKLPSDQEPGEIVLIGDSVVRSYYRGEGNDVIITDLKDVRASDAFDPRVLGLTDLMSRSSAPQTCVWIDAPVLMIAGSEDIRGTRVWRVRAGRGKFAREYWIEETSFRVHRVAVYGPLIDVQIDSEFAPSTSDTPFPKHVSVQRNIAGENRIRLDYHVAEFTVDVDIPKERFELESMEIPKGTAVVDYRINRRLGYWNGDSKKLTSRPVR